MKLSHKPGEWNGTFALAVQTAIEDLLSEAPFRAVIVVDQDRRREYTGDVLELTRVPETCVTMDLASKAETVYLPLDEIESIEIL